MDSRDVHEKYFSLNKYKKQMYLILYFTKIWKGRLPYFEMPVCKFLFDTFVFSSVTKNINYGREYNQITYWA